MKKIMIVFVCSLFLYGCGSSNKEAENPADNTKIEVSTEDKIEIEVGNSLINLSLPKFWKNLPAQPEKGIIFLAQSGTQNLVISHEKGFTENIIERLMKTLQDSFSMVEIILQKENVLVFRGKLSSTTPLREFYQKVLPITTDGKFLLLSCSQEVSNLNNLNCPEILDSFYLQPEETE